VDRRGHPATEQRAADRQQLAALRRALLAEIGALQSRIAAGESAHAAELASLRDERDRWREAVERVTTSKTWRYSESARAVYRRLRERRR
jgi:hypothetical protein